ncbi:MAG: Xaa-Pro peptidase family protein [Dorea sp.]|nr:Xaa-Pro peptidase family protein [Dorea sp.]
MSKIAEERLAEYLEKNHLDGFYITDPNNVRYISSYTGSDSFLLITRSKKYVISDARYTEQLAMECPDYEVVEYRKMGNGSVPFAAAFIANQDGLQTLAYEYDKTMISEYDTLKNNYKGEIVPLTGVIEEFRSLKLPIEIEYQRASCEIASRAYEMIIKDIRVGKTEKELAANLQRYMVLLGADTMPYGNILISGARTSLLHGIPSSKSIEYGDFVLMDYGCQYNGYMSDMTRTLVVGKANAKQREMYDYELKMSEAMIAAMKPGVMVKDVYDAAITPIKNTEYLQYFYSGIGHGIGLYVHEVPFINPKGIRRLQPTNVVTAEPGMYIPGWGGVRIEDQILITENGNENLISATKELIEL